MYEQGPVCVSVSPRICPDCTHMTWCVGHGTSACASWSLGTCLPVAGAGMQTDVKSASSSRCWRWMDAFKQCHPRQQQLSLSTIRQSQALGIGDPDLMRRPAASRVMKLCAGCGHYCWLYKQTLLYSAKESGKIIRLRLDGDNIIS